MPRKQLMILGIIWIAIIVMFTCCPNKVRAEDTYLPIELTMSDWQKVVTNLEGDKVCQEELQYVKDDNAILEKQNKLLKENMLLNEGINKSADKRIANLEKELELQDAACKKAIKEAKPSFFQEIGKAVIYVVIGIGLGFLL